MRKAGKEELGEVGEPVREEVRKEEYVRGRKGKEGGRVAGRRESTKELKEVKKKRRNRKGSQK